MKTMMHSLLAVACTMVAADNGPQINERNFQELKEKGLAYSEIKRIVREASPEQRESLKRLCNYMEETGKKTQWSERSIDSWLLSRVDLKQWELNETTKLMQNIKRIQIALFEEGEHPLCALEHLTQSIQAEKFIEPEPTVQTGYDPKEDYKRKQEYCKGKCENQLELHRATVNYELKRTYKDWQLPSVVMKGDPKAVKVLMNDESTFLHEFLRKKGIVASIEDDYNKQGGTFVVWNKDYEDLVALFHGVDIVEETWVEVKE